MMGARAYLQDPNQNGVSLYGHLTEVLATMLEGHTSDALDSLEAISMKVKDTHFTAESAMLPAAPTFDHLNDSSSAWHESSNKLIQLTAFEDGEEPGDTYYNPNLIEEAAYFNTAGVGIPSEELYRVYMSLHKLQKEKELMTIRFFGKVLGTNADYFIAEATYSGAEEEGDALPSSNVPIEEKGSGCNSFCYFACNDPAGDWTELPVVTPEQLVASAVIRKFFTGDLTAPVRAYPPFPGTEKEYLRAQIARIAAATVLCPKGKYMIEEESLPPKVVPFESEEESTSLSTSAMLEPSSWVCYNMSILGIGRCTHPPTLEEEEDEDTPKKDLIVLEPETPPLTPICADDWSIQLFNHMGSSVCVAVARSLQWPGAYSVMNVKEDKSSNLYIGFGHAALPNVFSVQQPPPVISEPDDVIEQIDMPLADENTPVLREAKTALIEALTAEAEAIAAEE